MAKTPKHGTPETIEPRQLALIKARLPAYKFRVIFDVGANLGQSALGFAQAYPEAQIHSFEPVPASFARLEEATREVPNITVHNFALGRVAEGRVMQVSGTSPSNLIVEEASGEGHVAIRTEVGHEVAAQLGIREISFLKIDTEGFDLQVLLGFRPLMPCIDFIQVEAAMNIHNRRHVPFRVLEDELRAMGFHLMHIFDQSARRIGEGVPILRRSNPLFVNTRLVEAQLPEE
jgi:FkbM family methyltransferase